MELEHIGLFADMLPYIGIGFAAQLIDGALGMAFGVICNTLLVGILGMPPALASAKVHVVECFTTASSGISHLYQRNIDRKLFLGLLVPGVIGGTAGAYLLTSIDASVVRPFVLGYLTLIGIYLVIKGLRHPGKPRPARHVGPLGLVGGFLDAAGGGGWGPVVTSNLLVQGVEPRKVIGSVSAVEFFLTIAVSAVFILQIGIADLVGPTLGLIVGGVIAAPAGAYAARRVAVKPLLTLVGVVLTITSLLGIWRTFG
ncbi:sulfite exporter TauE/SafE family protein [Croceicoccus sp. F390]|uniref:Probable membrane transporter protein n=1 Tax=Croceicoccus esteveae TaxID=3075597 RepID=A0ABU2ZHP1_9SPHN|nr:sulfite exporter TauE/SafE family protein [Croceicoccus sp. F390]MDT0576127.1 sulfite exporter TauE/SafE family protein [Croceicoccus sp. F390]